MKNRIFLFGFLIAIMIGGSILEATFNGDQTLGSQAVAQERHHKNHDDHDAHDEHKVEEHGEGHDVHSENDLEKHHDLHVDESKQDEHEGHDHGEEADIVEMTNAQQKEIGLALASARPGDIEHLLSLVGEVRLHEDRMAHIVSRVPGIVRSVSVSLGEKVEEDQILTIVDSPELAEVKADYLEKMRNFELARRTFERKQYLKQENIASEADWLEAQASFQNAETRLLSAKRKLIVLGLTERDIHKLSDIKDEEFARYELRSPVSGTIIYRHITRGEKIEEQDVFTVADLSVVWVDLQIPAQDIEHIKEGMPVEITSTEGRVAYGTLSLIGPVVDTESRTALGRVELPNPQGFWRPGTFVKGIIQGAKASSAVVVPFDAVQNIEGENVVFVPEKDGFKPVQVTLGKSVNNRVEILSGLASGDHYVTKGAFELKAIKVTSGAGSHAGHGH